MVRLTYYMNLTEKMSIKNLEIKKSVKFTEGGETSALFFPLICLICRRYLRLWNANDIIRAKQFISTNFL